MVLFYISRTVSTHRRKQKQRTYVFIEMKENTRVNRRELSSRGFYSDRIESVGLSTVVNISNPNITRKKNNNNKTRKVDLNLKNSFSKSFSVLFCSVCIMFYTQRLSHTWVLTAYDTVLLPCKSRLLPKLPGFQTVEHNRCLGSLGLPPGLRRSLNAWWDFQGCHGFSSTVITYYINRDSVTFEKQRIRLTFYFSGNKKTKL